MYFRWKDTALSQPWGPVCVVDVSWGHFCLQVYALQLLRSLQRLLLFKISSAILIILLVIFFFLIYFFIFPSEKLTTFRLQLWACSVPSIRSDFLSSKLERHFPPVQMKVPLPSKATEEQRADSELRSVLTPEGKKLLVFVYLHMFLKILSWGIWSEVLE